MFRHRKRLIAKRLTYRIHLRNSQTMKKMFRQFVKSRSKQIQQFGEQINQYCQQGEIQQIQQEIKESKYKTLDNQDQDSSSPQSDEDFQVDPHQYELPPTFFMTKKQKEKYFLQKNQQFQNKIKKTHQRVSNNKNKVHFTNNFLYKPFAQHQKVTIVKDARQYKEKYDNNIHFS